MNKPQRSYIAMLGRSMWGLLNAYYAVLQEKAYYPDTIYIITEETYDANLATVTQGLHILSHAFGFAPRIQHVTVPDADFLGAGHVIRSLVKDLPQHPMEVAIDITSGRKALVAGTLVSLTQIHAPVDHVYYLLITSLDDASKPYMMIPLHMQILKDFVVDAMK